MSTSVVERLTFQLLTDVEPTFALEQQGFPPEEAATPEKLTYRHQHAPNLFLGAYLTSDHDESSTSAILVGYVTSTLAQGETLTEASMRVHHPQGRTVCVHSVCVAPEYRRQGVALALLQAYTRHLNDENDRHKRETTGDKIYERIALITHDHLIPLYEKAGYALLGRSPVVHGPDPWYEMQQKL